MVFFHAFITVTFPLAVPLYWNVLFGFLAAYLFIGHPNGDGYGVGDLSSPWLLLFAAELLFFPVLGNLRPDLVSFLPSMRQYAANWASAQWALDRKSTRLNSSNYCASSMPSSAGTQKK